MKNHIILLLYINLHYYPRGVRLHLKNQTTSSRNHLKKTLFEKTTHHPIISPILEIILCQVTLEKSKKKNSLQHNYNSTWNRIAAFIFKTCPDLSWPVQTCPDLSRLNYKIIISETLLVMVFNLVIEPFTTFFFVSFTVSNVSQQVCIQENMCIN